MRVNIFFPSWKEIKIRGKTKFSTVKPYLVTFCRKGGKILTLRQDFYDATSLAKNGGLSKITICYIRTKIETNNYCLRKHSGTKKADHENRGLGLSESNWVIGVDRIGWLVKNKVDRQVKNRLKRADCMYEWVWVLVCGYSVVWPTFIIKIEKNN